MYFFFFLLKFLNPSDSIMDSRLRMLGVKGNPMYTSFQSIGLGDSPLNLKNYCNGCAISLNSLLVHFFYSISLREACSL